MSMTALLTAGGGATAILAVLALVQKIYFKKDGVDDSNPAAARTGVKFGHLGTLGLFGLPVVSLILFAAAYSTGGDRVVAAQMAEMAGPAMANPAPGPADNALNAMARLRAYGQTEARFSPIPERTNVPSVDTMIGRLAKRLESSPDDAKGWRMLGWSQAHTGNYTAAANAYARAVALSPDNTQWQSAYREVLAKVSSGSVPPVARTNTVPEPGPNADDIANAKKMAPRDRRAMIGNMVDRLARRLAEKPDDANGWIKLIRSRTVLGQGDKARAALNRALMAFSGDVAKKEEIVTAAKELGVRQD